MKGSAAEEQRQWIQTLKENRTYFYACKQIRYGTQLNDAIKKS